MRHSRRTFCRRRSTVFLIWSVAALLHGSIAAVHGATVEVPITGGYVMTHEHPTTGMAYGGNWAHAGSTTNYQNGISENAYGTCAGCTNALCDHAEVKGWFAGATLGFDMGNHGAYTGPRFDSFSHLRYSSQWIKEAFDPPAPYNDARMKVLVAFAIESEAMCELLYYENLGGGGAGAAGYPCTTGDSKASLVRQINSLKAWATAHSSWAEIAYTAADARRIANANKLVVVLGIEAEYAFGAEDSTVAPVTRLEEYHAMGVRTFYLAHKLNSRLAGADVYHAKTDDDGKVIRAQQAISGCFYYDDHVGAFPLVDGGHNYCDNDSKCGIDHFRGKAIWAQCNNKISAISEIDINTYINKGDTTFNGFAVYPKPPGFTGTGGTWMDGTIERNNLGLSTNGEAVVRRAMQLGMIMNLDHVSSAARDRIYTIARDEFASYPVNALHNNPSARLVASDVPAGTTPGPNEYDFTKAERDYIRTSGGIFGVRLAPIDSKEYPESGVTVDCPRTITETAKVLAFLVDEGLPLGYSLDASTIAEGVHSRTWEGCSAPGYDWLNSYGTTSTLGLAHIGQMKYFHKELESVGLTASRLAKLKSDGAEQFVDMWEDSEARATP